MSSTAEPGRAPNSVGAPPAKPKSESAEAARARYGAGVVLGAILVVLVAYVLALRAYDFTGQIKNAANSAAAVVAVMGSITTIIGTLVGAYFGVKVGEAGKAEAQDARDKAEDKVQKLALVADRRDPMAAQALGLNPDFE